MPTVEIDAGGMPVAPAPAAPAPETPTQQVVRRSNVESVVSLPDGRTLHFRPLRTLERMDLNSLAGSQNALNLAWMADASLAYAVMRIDNEPVAKPSNMLQLRALIQRLGDDGMDAISEHVQGTVAQEADAAAEKERAGN